jgi:hypothetical protein
MFRAFLMTNVFALAACLNATNVQAADDPHHEHLMKCAKACADCQLQCDMCFQHCAALLTQGEKAHAVTMRSCVDCAEVCKATATLSARHSPFTGGVCEVCVKVCDQCAASCEQFPDDKHMASCAKSCRDCAKECREMMKHAAN